MLFLCHVLHGPRIPELEIVFLPKLTGYALLHYENTSSNSFAFQSTSPRKSSFPGWIRGKSHLSTTTVSVSARYSRNLLHLPFSSLCGTNTPITYSDDTASGHPQLPIQETEGPDKWLEFTMSQSRSRHRVHVYRYTYKLCFFNRLISHLTGHKSAYKSHPMTIFSPIYA